MLIKEEKPVFFLYEIQTKTQTFTGIIAGTSIEDYQNNVIKKHEDTLQYRVELFKDYLHSTGFNTEPVLITYPDDAELTNWILEKNRLIRFMSSLQPKEKNTSSGRLKLLKKFHGCRKNLPL